MHTNQTYNSLTVDNPAFPFPSEVVPYLSSYDWDKTQWNVLGLPAFQSKFSLTGKQLYFEEDEKQNVHLKKETFTGQVLAAGVITPNDCEFAFFLTFELSFCNGVLVDAQLTEFRTENRQQYDIGFKKFQTSLDKQSRIRKSWWFKFLYTPYYYFLGLVTYLIVGVAKLFCSLVMFIANKMLPYKL